MSFTPARALSLSRPAMPHGLHAGPRRLMVKAFVSTIIRPGEYRGKRERVIASNQRRV
jgi:hypothetical protein